MQTFFLHPYIQLSNYPTRVIPRKAKNDVMIIRRHFYKAIGGEDEQTGQEQYNNKNMMPKH